MWIAMKDHEPDHLQRVLICDLPHDNVQIAYWRATAKPMHWDRGYFTLTGHMTSATHWQPCPEGKEQP